MPIFANSTLIMKRHLIILLSIIMMGFVFSAEPSVSSYPTTSNLTDVSSFIIDSQQKDIESCFNAANANKILLPELLNSLPSPSFRLLTSQKKTQQNLLNNILLKRFSSEVMPTKNYNNKSSSPLSSKENLIVIVRHLII